MTMSGRLNFEMCACDAFRYKGVSVMVAIKGHHTERSKNPSSTETVGIVELVRVLQVRHEMLDHDAALLQ